ncbi:hypothetical protein [Arcobacter cloacae]|uniref:Uncharacterized protein n=1 Tax=Arcobacter cloacae TaxID=1054034 RepID=A0A6M8NNG7_9BACT|nr:hypothetical protein [Arcobacter cloacae]QKF89967.1 hypothetical protein ACLO_1473 [Arcobacter cloacae]RXI40241.1 hypothetical protein CP963_09165 [Arcobacter cloacae]
MAIFKAIGYHGTNKEIKSKEDINFQYKQYQDHFLGCGFYLWRDSPYRAKNWTDNQHESNGLNSVLEIELQVNEDEILNFTSSKWSNELEVLKIFNEVCMKKGLHFGSFIDFLIYELDIDLKVISMMDLKAKNHFVPINSNAKTLFAYGDIQICVKSKDVIQEFKKVDIF